MTTLRNVMLGLAVGAANVMAGDCATDACSEAVAGAGLACGDFLKPSYNSTPVVPEALAHVCDVAAVSSACLCATPTAPVPSTSLPYYPPSLSATTTPSAPVAPSSPSGGWPTSIPPYITVYTTTSTVCNTEVHTITSCGPEVQHCPAESTVVVTSTIPLYTTVCPVTETVTPTTWAPKPTTWAPPANTTKLITSTIYSTHVYTKTACPPEVKDCPAHSKTVTTEIIPIKTTVCPPEVPTPEVPTPEVPPPPPVGSATIVVPTHNGTIPTYVKPPVKPTSIAPPSPPSPPSPHYENTFSTVVVSTPGAVPPVVPPVAVPSVEAPPAEAPPAEATPVAAPPAQAPPAQGTPVAAPPAAAPPAEAPPAAAPPAEASTPGAVSPPAANTPVPAGSSPAVITTAAATTGPSVVATAGGASIQSSIIAMALPLLVAALL